MNPYQQNYNNNNFPTNPSQGYGYQIPKPCLPNTTSFHPINPYTQESLVDVRYATYIEHKEVKDVVSELQVEFQILNDMFEKQSKRLDRLESLLLAMSTEEEMDKTMDDDYDYKEELEELEKDPEE